MANPASNIATINSDTPATSADITEKIKQRRSNELVIGLCGAIGSGVKSLKGTLESQLNQQGYVVEHIRLSELISKNSDDPEATQNLIGYNRYTKLQDLGDKLRENYRNSIMAELAVKEISISREIQFGKDRGALLQWKEPLEVNPEYLVLDWLRSETNVIEYESDNIFLTTDR